MGSILNFCKAQKRKTNEVKAKTVNMNEFIQKLPKQCFDTIQSKYDQFESSDGLEFDQIQDLFPNVQKELLIRIFFYFNKRNQKKLTFDEVLLMIGTINQEENQIKLLADIYDLDQDQRLNPKEIQLFIKENKKIIKKTYQTSSKYQNFSKDQFIEWADKIIDQKELKKGFTIISSPNMEKQIVSEIKLRELEEKQLRGNYYLISIIWWKEWQIYVANNQNESQIDYNYGQNIQPFASEQFLNRPGPIDNSSIAGEYEGGLKGGLIEDNHFVKVSQETWSYFVSWYGVVNKKHIFKRKFEMLDDQLNFDIYPKIIQGFETDVNGEIMFGTSVILKMNLDSTMHDIRKKLIKQFKIAVNPQNYLLYFLKIKTDLDNDNDWNLILDLDESIANYPQAIFFTITKLRMKPKCTNDLKLGDKQLIMIDQINKINKMCIVINFSADKNTIFWHKEGESFLNDFAQKINNNIKIQQNQTTNKQKQKEFYPGLINLGQTCYMNSIIQCLIATPFLNMFLQNLCENSQKYSYNQKESQSQKVLLITQLSLLTRQLVNEQEEVNYISPDNFQIAVSKIFPRFKLHDPQDADEFLDLLLQRISEELINQDNDSLIIDDLFRGQYITQHYCSSCQVPDNKFEDKRILRLNIQERSGIFKLKILFFKKYPIKIDSDFSRKNQLKSDELELAKQSISFEKDKPTIEDLVKYIFEHYNLRENQFEMAIVSNKDIKTLIDKSNPQVILSELGIQRNKTLYIYELGDSEQAEADYKEICKLLQNKSQTFKLQDFVEFSESGNQRKGKIMQILSSNYQKLYKIQYRSQQKFNSQIETIDIQEDQIKPFQAQVDRYFSIFKVRVMNYYLSALNVYTPILKPMILLIPIKQITFLELQIYIFKQIQRFFNFENQILFNTKEEIIQYFDQSNFPYKIRISDQQRKCLNCNKFVLSQCKGCLTDPLLLNFDNLRFCIIILEWKQTEKCLKQIKITSQNSNLEELQLEDCFNEYKRQSITPRKCEQCNTYLLETNFLYKPPIILVIYLQKRNSNFKHIRVLVKFNLNRQNIKKCLLDEQDIEYNLYAIVNYKSLKQQGHFSAYVKKGEKWFEFDDSISKEVDKTKLISTESYLLFYSRDKIPNDVKFNPRSYS